MSETTSQADVSVAERLDNWLAPAENVEPAPEQPDQEPVLELVQEVDGEESAEIQEESIEETEELEVEALNDDQDANDDGETLDLNDLAQYIGIDTDKLDLTTEGLHVKTKIDGVEGHAKFADILKSYQLEGHLNKQNIAATEKLKALEAREIQIDAQANERLNQLDDLSKMAYSKLTSEYNAINWGELREYEPGEYAAKQADFQRAQQEIQTAYSQVQSERQAQQSKRRESNNVHLAKEAELMLTTIPGWSDSAVASKEKADIGKHAMDSLGFTKDELNGMSDHRVMAIMRKAMLYDQLQSKSPILEKKVRKAPKLVKPGQSVGKKSRDATKLSKQRELIRKTGGKKGVTDYLMSKGIV